MKLVYVKNAGGDREEMVEVEVTELEEDQWYCKSTEAWMQYMIEDDRDGQAYVLFCDKRVAKTYTMVGRFIEISHTGEGS